MLYIYLDLILIYTLGAIYNIVSLKNTLCLNSTALFHLLCTGTIS